MGNAFGDAARSVLLLLTVEGRAMTARQEARRSWERLKRLPPARHRALVEEKPQLRSWALCELLCAESIKAAADDADRAVELAELALRVADLAPGEQAWRWRVQGYAWAHVGNAQRVKGDLPRADEGFATSAKLWTAGASGDPGLLDEAVVLSLEASLRIEQSLLHRASALLDRALGADKGSLKKSLLLQKAKLQRWSGAFEKALATLEQVSPLISREHEPRLFWLQQFNVLLNLCHLNRYRDSEALLPVLRMMAAQLGNGLDSLRLRWLEGRVAAGLGREEEALTTLSQVREELIARGIAFDAALSTLEVAVLYLTQDRTAEVRLLARQMTPIFEAQGIHREAIVALRLFCNVAEREALTLDLARRLVEYLYRAKHDPQLRFEVDR